MLAILGVLSGLLAMISYVPYVRDMLGKRVKPERASWLIWTVLAAIAFFSQAAKGATHSLWFTGLDSVGAFVVFALAIKFGVGGLTRRDMLALLAAGVGLLLWHATRNAIYALLITIGVDAIGTVLTVLKTLEHPHTETYTMWLLVCAAGLLATVSVGRFNATLMAYPFYIFLANSAVAAAIYGGRRIRRVSAKH